MVQTRTGYQETRFHARNRSGQRPARTIRRQGPVRYRQSYEGRKWKAAEAISAYQKVVDEYPSSPYAPEAQFKIGKMLMAGASKGNQDNSNLDRALNTFADLRQSYPNSKAATEATKMISEIYTRDLQRTFDIAEFYLKKGQQDSARIYYREVVRKTGKGELHDRARNRLQSLQAAE